MREFVDGDGTRWRVWSSLPVQAGLLTQRYEEGWLTFESRGALKRVAPSPDRWEELTDSALERLCRTAERVVRRTPGALESALERAGD